jgi:hypothetical protein
MTRGLLAVALLLAQPAPPRPATPLEPIGAILEAFTTHPVVGISDGESHGDVRGPEFVVRLINDPRFASTTIDIVMENANARYQDVMDRYTSGDDVPFAELRRVWDDTTQAEVISPNGVVPIIYTALRDLNRTLPPAAYHRALLGDPPIDWDHVQSPADFRPWLEKRDESGAAVVQHEALDNGRRALLVYGSGHLQRKQQATNYVMDHRVAQTVVSLLERAGVGTFIIATVPERDETRAWPYPSLALIRGTTLGAEDVPQGSLPRVVVQPDGSFVPIPKEQWVTRRMDEQFDALIYLGPKSTRHDAQLSPAICTEPAHVDTHLRRMSIAGMPPFELDRVRKLCAEAK